MSLPRDDDEGLIRLEEARARIDVETYEALDEDLGAMTRAVHGGEPQRASAVPIHAANAVGEIYAYTRYSNPTVQAFEAKLRELEGGAGTIATASGMAAVSQTLLGLLRSGDRLVVHRRLFVGIRSLLSDFIGHYGIEVEAIDMTDPAALSQALRKPAKMVFFETIPHPPSGVIDAPRVLAMARAAGALSVVDNTLLTPCLFQPLRYGADLVIHSATKYIGGHGDAMGGVVTAGSEELAQQIRRARRVLGGVLGPATAYLLLRGLKTLPLRIERHCDNALQVAAFLAEHPRVAEVHYPGLPSSAGHATAASFLERFGGVLSFRLAADRDKESFGRALRLCKVRLSFGEASTVALIQDEDPLIRVSVGLENPEDVLRDLDQALAAA